MHRRRRIGSLIIALCAVSALGVPAASAAAPVVREVVLNGDIDPVTARFVTGQIHAANDAGQAAVLLRIDTPGGLDDSMRQIIQAELASKVPVIAYVAPNGARAASAGVFIVEASDLAAMAPQTNIGSSTPVGLGQDLPSGDLKNKIVNDAAARIRALATTHGRNATWAEQAVRHAANITAAEALKLGVIEIVAADTAGLLRQADGRTTKPKGITLNLDGATVETHTLPLHLRILDVLINPNLISLLFLGGLILIGFEVAHPGAILPGFAGATMLVLALFGLSVLPFTWTGLLLLVGGAALMLAEVHVGHGALGAIGVGMFVVGAYLLFDTHQDGAQVSLPFIVGVALVLGTGFVFLISRTQAVRREPAATGATALIGRHGEVRETLDPEGMVFVHGELWSAVSDGAPIAAGEGVVVERLEGLTLHVQPAPMEESLQ
jgi:membrane-bound serine protease (ClpP class)